MTDVSIDHVHKKDSTSTGMAWGGIELTADTV